MVQHIAKGFLEGMVEWLNHTTDLPIHIAMHKERLMPGHVYFAPDDYHMGLNSSGRIELSKALPENALRPSVSYLFRSAINACDGDTVGVLLTGMGKDGAEELREMKESGAITIAQDEESSVVFGMPRGGAWRCIYPPAGEIAAVIRSLTKRGDDILNHNYSKHPPLDGEGQGGKSHLRARKFTTQPPPVKGGKRVLQEAKLISNKENR